VAEVSVLGSSLGVALVQRDHNVCVIIVELELVLVDLKYLAVVIFARVLL